MGTNTTPETYEEKNAREEREHAETRKKTRAQLVRAFELCGFIAEAERVDKNERPWGPQVHLNATRADGALLSASADGYAQRDRVAFFVSYPRPKVGELNSHGLPRPEITCALTKTPEQMAKDIKRRLLPEYEAGLIEARKRIAATESYHGTRSANMRVILGRDELKPDELKEGRSRFYFNSDKKMRSVSGDIEVYDEDANLKLSGVPVALAARIMDMIRAEVSK